MNSADWHTRCGLRQLFALSISLFGCLAGFEGDVFGCEADTDFLQEGGWRSSAGENPHKVIRYLLLRSGHLQDHRFRLEFHRIGIEEYFYLPRFHAVLNAAFVALFDAAEALAPVGQRHLVSQLIGETHGSLNRAVASTDHQNLLVDVVIALNEAVHDLRQVFAFDAEFAGLAGSSQGQDP